MPQSMSSIVFVIYFKKLPGSPIITYLRVIHISFIGRKYVNFNKNFFQLLFLFLLLTALFFQLLLQLQLTEGTLVPGVPPVLALTTTRACMSARQLTPSDCMAPYRLWMLMILGGAAAARQTDSSLVNHSRRKQSPVARIGSADADVTVLRTSSEPFSCYRPAGTASRTLSRLNGHTLQIGRQTLQATGVSAPTCFWSLSRAVHPPSAPGSKATSPKLHQPHQSRLSSLTVYMHRQMKTSCKNCTNHRLLWLGQYSCKLLQRGPGHTEPRP